MFLYLKSIKKVIYFFVYINKMSVDYESIYKNLSSQVSDITDRNRSLDHLSYFETPKINKNETIACGIVLLIIAIILFIWKPSFITDVKFGTKNRVINYSKFLVIFLVLSTAIAALYIYYLRQHMIKFF